MQATWPWTCLCCTMRDKLLVLWPPLPNRHRHRHRWVTLVCIPVTLMGSVVLQLMTSFCPCHLCYIERMPLSATTANTANGQARVMNHIPLMPTMALSSPVVLAQGASLIPMPSGLISAGPCANCSSQPGNKADKEPVCLRVSSPALCMGDTMYMVCHGNLCLHV